MVAIQREPGDHDRLVRWSAAAIREAVAEEREHAGRLVERYRFNADIDLPRAIRERGKK